MIPLKFILLWNPRPWWSQRSQRIQKALWAMPMRNFGNDWVDDRRSCRQLQHGPRWSTSGISIPKKMPTRNVPQQTKRQQLPRHAICRNKFLVSFYRSSSCFDLVFRNHLCCALFSIFGAGCQSDKPHRRRCSKKNDMKPHRQKGSRSDPPIGWREASFTKHEFLHVVYESQFTGSWFMQHSLRLRVMIYETYFTKS